MKKIVSILAVSAFIASSIPVANVSAKNDEAVAAIAGIIALGVIGAAVGKHQHQQGYEDYRPHPQLHSDENAVGTCMHHTEKVVEKAGGYGAQLNSVDKVELKPNGNTVVVFHASGIYNFGSKESRVRCVVKNHRIVKFEYNAAADEKKKPSRPSHDNAPTPGSNERAYYDDGCHEGTIDAQNSMSMAYVRHADMYDSRFEPYFKQGYEACWKHFR